MAQYGWIVEEFFQIKKCLTLNYTVTTLKNKEMIIHPFINI